MVASAHIRGLKDPGRDRTAEDGSDLGVRLERLFRVLNTAAPQRQRNLDEELRDFPCVNG